MLTITFQLRPDESLTAQQVQEIVDKARSLGLTPEQWIKRLVMERVKQSTDDQSPKPQPAAAA
jgi:hypothetical protein